VTVRVERVSHDFGPTAVLRDATLSVEPGEIVCLLGPSGCGKTTLLRVVAGLERLQSGRILVGGADIAHLPPERRGIGLLFQDFALFPHLSALDNVAFGVGGDRARAREVLRRLGMEEHAPAYPHTLSGGQQQRIALARALAPGPHVMLLDEPFSGLDTGLRARLRDDTLHILKGSGAATILVTHDPEEAMFMGDRIAVMDRGRIEQIGRPEDLYLRPTSAFVAGFFGEVNRFAARIANGAAATPLGALPAPGLAEGTEVEVLIRPEALVLGGAGEGTIDARVLAARMLGRTSLIHLEIAGEPPLHLHSRMPGDFLPPEGARVCIRLDRRRAYLFPLAEPGPTLVARAAAEEPLPPLAGRAGARR
jgi:iron(III) transport system ATP-binding protein